ncbi:MAG: GNAT family N-acetyltransferase [Pseudomonadota bacterium]
MTRPVLTEAPPHPAAATPPPWLSTRTLLLREFVPADRHDLVRMHQEPRLRALLIDDEPLHRHDVAAEFLHRLQPLYRRREGLGIWRAERLAPLLDAQALADPQLHELLSPEAIAELAAPRPRFAGWFNLMPMPEPHGAGPGAVELGARLLPEAWGTGLALEGGEALLRHAFGTLALPRVWAVCHPQHQAVRYCVLSLGFADRGVQPYGEVPARHFVIEREAWQRHHTLPRRARVRAALAALHATGD